VDENSRRRKRIIDFIIEHQGCTIADIERGLKGEIARTVIFRHIKELKNEEIILNISGKKNRNTLVPNKDNEIWLTEERLLDFKKKYLNLLKKSFNHSQMSNVVNEIKSKSEKMEDRLKIGEILGKIYSEFRYANETYSKTRLLVKYTEKTFSESVNVNNTIQEFYSNNLLEQRDSIPSQILKERIAKIKSSEHNLEEKMKDSKISKLEIQEIKKLSEKTISNINNIKNLQEQYSIHIENSGYLVLTSWPIFLFLFLEYIINLRSITVWPENIVDKKLLYELNEFVHNNIEEIKTKLIDFLSKSKNERVKSEMESIMSEINPIEKEEYFIKMFYDYSILNMKKEIIEILDSLNKIGKKNIEYNEQNDLNKIYDSSKMLLDSCFK